MCKLHFPRVASFLMLYSLRCGCIFTGAWTLLRSLAFILFFLVTATWTFNPTTKAEAKPSMENYIFTFLSYVAMIVNECFVFMFTVGLVKGVYTKCPCLVKDYLISRISAWIIEIITLGVLCFCYQYHIGFYIVFLMIITLEFYAFIVVYSYYLDMVEEVLRRRKEGKEPDLKHDNCECDIESVADTLKRRETHETCTMNLQDAQYKGGTRDPRDKRDPQNKQDPRDKRDARDTRVKGVPQDLRNVIDMLAMRDPRIMRALQFLQDTQDHHQYCYKATKLSESF